MQSVHAFIHASRAHPSEIWVDSITVCHASKLCPASCLQGEESWSFNPEQIDLLIQIWGHVSRIDGTISHYQLVKLLRSLLPPLGVGPSATVEDTDNYIQSLGIVQVLGKRYTFEHTTFALISSVAGASILVT